MLGRLQPLQDGQEGGSNAILTLPISRKERRCQFPLFSHSLNPDWLRIQKSWQATHKGLSRVVTCAFPHV